MKVFLNGSLFCIASFFKLNEKPEEVITRYNMPLPDGELTISLEWNEVRIARDALIEATDWTQVTDCPLSDEKKTEFLAYRQALRDIPQNYSDPDAVVWPEKPIV